MEEQQVQEDEKPFVCECEIEPLGEWVQKDIPGTCPPCLIKPLAEGYLFKLEEAQAAPQINVLKQAWGTENTLTIAKALDTIKGEVEDHLKQDLLNLDCIAQTHRDRPSNEGVD